MLGWMNIISMLYYLLCRILSLFPFFFFFNDTATTEIYTLSLHDALPIHAVFDGPREARAHCGLVAVADGLDKEIPQRPALELELAQHVENLSAQGLPGLLELLQQPPIDVALARFLGHQVPQVADLGLADAVDPAEPLLQAVRVPGQVVVHHQVRALEVDALASGVGGEEHLHFGIVQKALLRLAPFLTAQAAMDEHDSLWAAKQRANLALQVVEGVAVLGEHDKLLARRRNRHRNRTRTVGHRGLSDPST